MNEKKEKRYEIVFYLGVFLFIFVWFSRIHPLAIYDGDDWTYITFGRTALPEWGAWNPAKVFPEVVMPLCSTAAVHVLMPLVGDYLTSMEIMNAFVASVFITAYIYCFGSLIKRLFSLSSLSTVYMAALFLVFHFLALRSQEADNHYLFFCEDTNCYYNYLFPALLNASLVMCMIENKRFDEFLANSSWAKKGLFFAVLYFAIFSNMVDSVILAVYAGSRILIDFIRKIKKDFRLAEFLKANSLYVLIMVLWLISAVFELSGGRAGMHADVSIVGRLKDTIYYLKEAVFRKCNKVFLYSSIAIMVISAILLIVSKRKDRMDVLFQEQMTVCFTCVAAMLVCMLILCAIVSPKYISRPEYLFSMVFYVFLIVLACLSYIIVKYPKVLVAIPLAICVLISMCDTVGKTYAESNMSDWDAEICTQISRDLVEQVVAADQAGLTEMTLYVPDFVPDSQTADNWPHSVGLMHRMTKALYEHGIIHYPVEITEVIPSMEFNEKYNLRIEVK